MKNHFKTLLVSFLKGQNTRLKEKGLIPTIDLLLEEIDGIEEKEGDTEDSHSHPVEGIEEHEPAKH